MDAHALARPSFAFTLCALVAGCANFNTIGRTTTLPKDGIAIHLDAPQRLVYANQDGSVCAEPSPDALQAYASSLGASFSAPSKESASIASALSENSSSIGLRTQSITLMRDALYRICEAKHNGSIGREDVVLLLERSQDMTLGVLAIEQLTGAVVARQTILTTGANAQASANVNNTQAALDAARKDEATKKAALDKATAAQAAQKTQVATDSTTAAASKTKAGSAQATVDKLTAELPKDQAQLTSDSTAIDKTQATLKIDQGKVTDLDATVKKLQAATPVDQTAVTKAIADLATATALVVKDNAQLTTDKATKAKQEAVVAQTKADLDKAKKDPTVVQAAKDAATLKAAQDTLAKDDAAVTANTTAYTDAQKVTLAIEENLNAAVATAHDVANGAGTFSAGADRDNVNKDTAKTIADATTLIVDKVVNKGHLTDSCLNIITSYSQRALNTDDARVQKVLELCQAVFDADLLVYKNNPSGPHPAAAAAAIQ